MTRASSSSEKLTLVPVGTVSSPLVHRQDAPRQGALAGAAEACITLRPELTAGLRGLAGFERIWVLFHFHKNREAHLLTRPPQTSGPRVGVFASRSPYRPGGIGMSAVRLLAVEGNRLRVGECDLLDGTPVLDIKPYLPYCDAFPAARTGWLEERAAGCVPVRFTARVMHQLAWIRVHGGPPLAGFARRELSWQPDDNARKRLYHDRELDTPTLAYRTWRLPWQRDAAGVTVLCLKSSYSDAELADPADPYGDRELQLAFLEAFPGARDPRL